MQTFTQTAPNLSVNDSETATRPGVFMKFYNWTVAQEGQRFKWMAFAFLLQIGVALPCTLLSIVYFGGNNFSLWIIACIVNVPPLVVNLAAQPTKLILPVLFFAWLVDVAIIIYALASFLLHL